MLEVRGLDVRYGKSHVIFDLDLNVGDGELVTLLGRNGAGKTTTLLGIVGLLPGATGTVRIGDIDISRWPSYRRTKGHIAYVPSGARCFPNLTVLENLELTAHSDGGSGWNLRRVFEMFPRLEPLKANLAGGLSGGERQMLAVGRALMSDPKLLMLDEPSLGLAPVVVDQLYDTLERLHDDGLTLLLAEQSVPLALQIADHAYVLQTGRTVLEGPAAELENDPQVQRIYLGVTDASPAQ